VSALDPEVTLQLRDDVPAEIFAKIVATFEADSARLLDAMAAADEAGFARGAHTLAGAAGAVGARDLAATARLAMTGSGPGQRAALMPRLRQQADLAVAELRALAEARR
jgi:HPt (histidine-containing phosphotransfer) domain-containing protein